MRRPLSLLPAVVVATACATSGSSVGSSATPASAASAASSSAAERGAFVVRLGSDTIAVEKFARSGNRIEGDEAMRTPAAGLRHYVVTLGADGSVREVQYEARRISGSVPPTRATMTFGAETTTVALSAGGRDTTLRYAARGAMPYVNLSYGMLEALTMRQLAAPASGDTIRLITLGAPQPVPAVFRRVGSDSVTFAVFETTPYRARVDERGRILGLQGLGTTQKVVVERVADVDVAGTAAAWARRDSAGQALGVLSPLDSLTASVGAAQLRVVYSRPAQRGRTIMGGVVPYDQVWRTGANAATMFTTSRDLVIGGATVPAGSYTLWTLPSAGGAKLIINKQTGQWGTDYDASKDLVRVDAAVTKVSPPVDRFTFAIEPNAAGTGGTLKYAWGDTQFAVPFTVK
ncbi:MAG: DUF2911 domain-containing protein [Gemmatimonadaceae bacterium]